MMLSINKSKLQQLVVNLNPENDNVLIPGSYFINIRKNKGKTYTDNGEQMIMRFQLKRYFNTKTLDSYDNLINRLDSILFRSHKVSSIKEAAFIKNKTLKPLPYNLISFKNIKPERILAHKIKNIWPIEPNILTPSPDSLILLKNKEGNFKPKKLNMNRINRL